MLACWRVACWDDNNSLWGASVWNVWLFLKYIPCLKYLLCLLTPFTHPIYHHTLSTHQLPDVHVHTTFLLENRIFFLYNRFFSSPIHPFLHPPVSPHAFTLVGKKFFRSVSGKTIFTFSPECQQNEQHRRDCEGARARTSELCLAHARTCIAPWSVNTVKTETEGYCSPYPNKWPWVWDR